MTDRACICTAVNPCAEGERTGCPICDHLDIYEPCPQLGHGCGLGGLVKPGDPWHESTCCTDDQLLAAAGGTQ